MLNVQVSDQRKLETTGRDMLRVFTHIRLRGSLVKASFVMGDISCRFAKISYTSGSINFTKLNDIKFIILFTPLSPHLHYVK